MYTRPLLLSSLASAGVLAAFFIVLRDRPEQAMPPAAVESAPSMESPIPSDDLAEGAARANASGRVEAKTQSEADLSKSIASEADALRQSPPLGKENAPLRDSREIPGARERESQDAVGAVGAAEARDPLEQQADGKDQTRKLVARSPSPEIAPMGFTGESLMASSPSSAPAPPEPLARVAWSEIRFEGDPPPVIRELVRLRVTLDASGAILRAESLPGDTSVEAGRVSGVLRGARLPALALTNAARTDDERSDRREAPEAKAGDEFDSRAPRILIVEIRIGDSSTP
jgi:hypothetical protein